MGSNSRAIAFLFLAVVSAFVAVLLTREYVQGERNLPPVAAATVVETAPVVVAGEDLPAGATVLTGQLSVVDWPKGFLPSGHFQNPQEVDRRVLSRSLKKNEPVLESALVVAGAGAGLSALISANHRAITVKVDPVVGVAGFIQPRSRVDVIATMRRDDRTTPYTGMILQDINVLAIDQKLDETRAGEPQLVSVVTLEVTPEEAQKLAYANTEGALQLVLRNPTDESLEQLEGVTGRDVVTVYEPPAPQPVRRSAPPAVEAIRGSTVRQETY